MGGIIDLSSDTATMPSKDMIAFMVGCPLGDDQKQEDPTVNRLQDEVSSLLAALRLRGVRTGAWPYETKVRAVTHLDLTPEDIVRAADCVREAVRDAGLPKLRAAS